LLLAFAYYVVIRAGRTQDGIASMRKVVELDPTDQTKTSVLLAVVENAIVALPNLLGSLTFT